MPPSENSRMSREHHTIMTKTQYTQQPPPVLIQQHGAYVHITVAANATQTGTEPEEWETDTHAFWEQKGELNLADLRAHPEAYLHYIPRATRQAAKDKAQQMLDTLRTACPVVPVPSYREGAAVCNRPADQVKLVAGLAMGGLPYYELASGEVVALSEADIKAIAVDVTAAETRWQQAKQACWAAIDAAGSTADMDAALAAFVAVLRGESN